MTIENDFKVCEEIYFAVVFYIVLACTFRNQAVMVEPKHVALQSISEDSEGRLVFYMYIQLEQGILAVEVVHDALQVATSLQHFH